MRTVTTTNHKSVIQSFRVSSCFLSDYCRADSCDSCVPCRDVCLPDLGRPTGYVQSCSSCSAPVFSFPSLITQHVIINLSQWTNFVISTRWVIFFAFSVGWIMWCKNSSISANRFLFLTVKFGLSSDLYFLFQSEDLHTLWIILHSLSTYCKWLSRVKINCFF